MATRHETDYLVVGAGATGMAFVDTLVRHADVEVMLVDRHHLPGGHWNHAYPFVRLHLPSTCYGVDSRPLGHDRIDERGLNAGLYERATAPELNDYYQRVLDEHLLPTGQVTFAGMSEYLGVDGDEHRVVHRPSGEITDVRVRRRLVDATLMEASVPATHTPSFAVDDGATMIPVNALVDLADTPTGYTVIGSGKTAIDACVWLLEQRVDPERIRWIRPRDAWHLDRAAYQPLELLPAQIEGFAVQLEAAATASTVADVFDRLEAAGQLVRLDDTVEPTMFRCAMLSSNEVDELRRIERVVRRGRLRRVGTDRLTLDDGEVPTDPREVHVDCSAQGLPPTPPRPVFEPGRITLQQVRMCQPAFNAALLGIIEAADLHDDDRNDLSPPNPYPAEPLDWIRSIATSFVAQQSWSACPDVELWAHTTRLDLSKGGHLHVESPDFHDSMTRLVTNLAPALANLRALTSGNG